MGQFLCLWNLFVTIMVHWGLKLYLECMLTEHFCVCWSWTACQAGDCASGVGEQHIFLREREFLVSLESYVQEDHDPQ